VYRGRAFSFVVEDLTLPNGKRTAFPVIRHPGSTGIVPLAADGAVVMTYQYRHAVGDYLLEIPAGALEKGESPLACARRELEEETGYTAQEFIELARVYIVPAYSDEQIYVYLARNLQPSTQHLDEDEIIRVVNYPLEELLQLIRKGAITDALTILALHQAHCYLQTR
jgi:ADP-ribose pyrophosphatase